MTGIGAEPSASSYADCPVPGLPHRPPNGRLGSKGEWWVSGGEREKLPRAQVAVGGGSRPQTSPPRRILAVNNPPGKGIAIRFFLDQHRRLRDRALFDLAVDSKLRGCDVVRVKIGDLVIGGQIRTRAIVVQQKTGRPVQFELLTDARASLLAWLERRGGTMGDYVFPSRVDRADHLSTRQYARLVSNGRDGQRKNGSAPTSVTVAWRLSTPPSHPGLWPLILKEVIPGGGR
jgi:hypothetical protein